MISILMPTRGRPDIVKRVVESIANTMSVSGKVELVLRVDEDDQSNYTCCLDGILKTVLMIKRPTFPDMGKMWNEAFENCTGDIIMMAGDDLIFRTQDWDLIVENEFANLPDDKIALVWGSDGGMNERLATHGFVHRKWVNIIGYFAPPYGLVYGNDDWVYLIAFGLGRLRYLPNLYIQHSPIGRNRRMRVFKQLSNLQVYSEWGKLLRQQAIDKLQWYIDAKDWSQYAERDRKNI